MVFPRVSLTLLATIVVDLVAILLLVWKFYPDHTVISPLPFSSQQGLRPGWARKSGYQVFGFAPYWNLDKLSQTDFSVLTTLAYFGVPVQADGTFDRGDPGYQAIGSDNLESLLAKAGQNGTRTVLTLTQMDNATITSFLDNSEAQTRLISDTLVLLKAHGFSGVNLDFEYSGDPGDSYRDRFSAYVERFSRSLHQNLPGSQLSVAIYAASVKDKKLYDVGHLARVSDAIFVMAYDFANASSDIAMPTAPLTGHKSGNYWYDVSSAVTDLLTEAPADKLILGVPWYGYLYAVSEPKVAASANQGYYVYYRRGRKTYRYWVKIPAMSRSYAVVAGEINPAMAEATTFVTGWDEHGQVPWKAYLAADGIWRMIFYDDVTSLAKKYDLVKEKKLAGVGIWALGYEEGRGEMWQLLAEKFGTLMTQNETILSRRCPSLPHWFRTSSCQSV